MMITGHSTNSFERRQFWCARRAHSTSLFAAVLAVLSSCSLAGASQSVRVHDGDTLTIDGTRWRLWGADAPELDQTCQPRNVACGKKSRDHLRALVAARVVVCEKRGRSRDRIVGVCRADGVDLAAAQVEAGHALDYPRYSRGEYADAQTAARTKRLGVWAYEFISPESWRRGQRR